MFKLLSNLLITITLLVAFVGQTMAYHFIPSFDGIIDQHKEIQQQASVKVYDSESADTLDDDCCEVDCCESDCICPANGCASIAYIASHIPQSELVFLSESLLLLAAKNSNVIASSLFRPPIFTS